MDALLWRRIGGLFDAARQLKGEERNAFLREQCGDDQALLEQVLALLDADNSPGPLDSRPTISSLPVPDLVAGRFRIVRFIAEGGMGTVYEAEDLQLHDRVALKTIRPEIALDTKAIERFKREILLGKSVTHPNVCRIHDLIVDHSDAGAEVLYLSMQYLDGETVAARIARGPIPQTEALPLIEDMADGLSAAHEADVIHRDFKSGNVMLVKRVDRKHAVISDFGLARPVRDNDLRSLSRMAGTVDYMAPEQIRGEDITPAADIYALGVVMYEMVTGQRPFTADSKIAVAMKHLHDEPRPPRELAPQLDQTWNAAILHCLKKAPSERFQSAEEVKAAVAGHFSTWRRSSNRRALGWLLISIALMLILLMTFFPLNKAQHGRDPVSETSIAVLPFQETGDTPEYFGFGFTEEVMNALGQVPDIHLIGPETSRRFKTSDLSPMEMGQELNARYLLIGSVHRLGKEVHVIVRMVDTKNGSQLWSRDISKGEEDVLVLPDEIARTVSQQLNISLTNTHLRGQRIDSGGLTARDLYWTGRFYFHQRTDDAVRRSLDYFRQAVKSDPTFAEAHCGLADALFVLAERNLLPPNQALVEARQAATRAVALDDRLPAAYVSLAQITSVYDRNLDEAERLFHRALALDSRLSSGWQWLSYLLAKERRFPEAVQAAEKAVAADPLSTAANINLAVVSLYAGLDDRVLQQSRRLEQMETQIFVHHLLMAEVFSRKGLFSEAVHEMESVPEAHQDHPMTLRVWVEIYARAGMKDTAQEALERLLGRAQKGGVPPTYIAAAYAATGNKKEAFAWLERACNEMDPFASVANAYPAFDSIRSDPRWAPLMSRLGFKANMIGGSTDPRSEGSLTTQVLPERRTGDLEQISADGVADPEPRLGRRGFAVQGGLSLSLEHLVEVARPARAA